MNPTDNFRFIRATRLTLAILADDLSPAMDAAIELLLEGFDLLEIPSDELDRDQRRDLRLLRDNLITTDFSIRLPAPFND